MHARAKWADAIEKLTVPGVAVVLARLWAHRHSFDKDTTVQIYAVRPFDGPLCR